MYGFLLQGTWLQASVWLWLQVKINNKPDGYILVVLLKLSVWQKDVSLERHLTINTVLNDSRGKLSVCCIEISILISTIRSLSYDFSFSSHITLVSSYSALAIKSLAGSIILKLHDLRLLTPTLLVEMFGWTGVVEVLDSLQIELRRRIWNHWLHPRLWTLVIYTLWYLYFLKSLLILLGIEHGLVVYLMFRAEFECGGDEPLT